MELADCVLELRDDQRGQIQRVHAHRILLVASSEFFRSWILGSLQGRFSAPRYVPRNKDGSPELDSQVEPPKSFPLYTFVLPVDGGFQIRDVLACVEVCMDASPLFSTPKASHASFLPVQRRRGVLRAALYLDVLHRTGILERVFGSFFQDQQRGEDTRFLFQSKESHYDLFRDVFHALRRLNAAERTEKDEHRAASFAFCHGRPLIPFLQKDPRFREQLLKAVDFLLPFPLKGNRTWWRSLFWGRGFCAASLQDENYLVVTAGWVHNEETKVFLEDVEESSRADTYGDESWGTARQAVAVRFDLNRTPDSDHYTFATEQHRWGPLWEKDANLLRRTDFITVNPPPPGFDLKCVLRVTISQNSAPFDLFVHSGQFPTSSFRSHSNQPSSTTLKTRAAPTEGVYYIVLFEKKSKAKV